MTVVLRNAENEKPLQLVKDCFRSLEELSKPQYDKFISKIKDNSDLSLLYSVATEH